MEPKYLSEEVTIHPTHHLTFGEPGSLGCMVLVGIYFINSSTQGLCILMVGLTSRVFRVEEGRLVQSH